MYAPVECAVPPNSGSAVIDALASDSQPTLSERPPG